MSDLKRLQRQIGYSFRNEDLLIQALTHCSAGTLNNERLEFLGDSILNCIIANALVSLFPDVEEGTLSRLRASLVKGDTLAILAREHHLGDYLILGQGELRSGGFRRGSILSDAFEAIIASIFLDGGFETCNSTVLAWYQSRLEDPRLLHTVKDPKTRLQEFLQSARQPLPKYEISNITGEEPDQVFTAICHAGGMAASGQGSNRRKAEQEAASRLLQKLTEKS